MMRPAGRLPAGVLAVFRQPMPLQGMQRHAVPCLRAFSRTSIRAAASVSPDERRKLFRDVKKGKRLKLTRLSDIPEDIGYLGTN